MPADAESPLLGGHAGKLAWQLRPTFASSLAAILVAIIATYAVVTELAYEVCGNHLRLSSGATTHIYISRHQAAWCTSCAEQNTGPLRESPTAYTRGFCVSAAVCTYFACMPPRAGTQDGHVSHYWGFLVHVTIMVRLERPYTNALSAGAPIRCLGTLGAASSNCISPPTPDRLTAHGIDHDS